MKLDRIKEFFLKPNSKKDDFYKQVYGGIMGFCVGDTMGVPYEFKLREEIKEVGNMVGYGTHNQPPGSWSDDSSLTFCLVENITNGYEREKLKALFCEWYYYGYWAHNKKLPFDIGQSTFKAISKIKAGIKSGETGGLNESENGNGSLMRVLPLSYYLLNESADRKFPIIEEVSGITHAHIRSKIACSIYVEFCIQLIKKHSPQEAYKHMQDEITMYYLRREYKVELNAFNRILEDDLSNLNEDMVKSSGYVVDSLEACIWTFLTTKTYEEAVLTAIRLGDDTDTIGALTGGLAGIHYGFSAIPNKWIKKIARKEDIKQLIDGYYSYLMDKINVG